MYSQQDIDDAVAAGAIPRSAADALRAYVAQARATPTVDQEHFRLVLGFNDVFVAIAGVIMLVAVSWIGQSLGEAIGLSPAPGSPSLVAGVALAATAWGLSSFFTGKKRMALPSILFLFGFTSGVFTATAGLLALLVDPDTISEMVTGLLVALAFAVTALAARLHWNAFRVPITVAAGAVSVAGIVGALAIAGLNAAGLTGDALESAVFAIILALGLAIFAFAMRWDASDPARITRRSDVAFWLHLAASIMIVHPLFQLLGFGDGDASLGDGLVAVALYIALGIVALAIDRRAMLVSALAYVLWALSDLLERFGAVELNVALTALVIGSALLLLSATWHQARVAVVRMLPGSLTRHLPTLEGAGSVSVSPEPVG